MMAVTTPLHKGQLLPKNAALRDGSRLLWKNIQQPSVSTFNVKSCVRAGGQTYLNRSSNGVSNKVVIDQFVNERLFEAPMQRRNNKSMADVHFSR